MTAVTTFLLGAMAGIVGTLTVMRFKRRKRPSPLQPQSSEKKTYGHPRPPVSTLRDRVPAPPQNHEWEVRVQHDKQGTPFLYLTLINLLSGQSVGETKTDLVRGGYPWDTWAAYYRNWSSASTRRKAFDDRIIGPMVDWATMQVNRIAHAGDVGEYSMGDGR